MPRKLEVRHFAAMVALADHSTMAAAAAALGLTQSALSHRLSEAERRLGALLFRRERRSLALTPAGERLLLSARRFLGELARVESDVSQIAASGVVAIARLGQSIYSDVSWYPAFHGWARGRLRDLQIEFAADTAERALDLVAEDTLDCALVVGESQRPGIALAKAFTDSLVAVASPGHRWAGLARVMPEDLLEETFLSWGFQVLPGFENERFMRPSGSYPRHVVKCGGRPEVVLELVAAGRGVSILSAWATASAVRSGRIVARELGPRPLALDWHVATRADDLPDRPGPRLATALREWCRVEGEPGLRANRRRRPGSEGAGG
jgi:LysR family transcriptional regulator, regulator for metE and metH